MWRCFCQRSTRLRAPSGKPSVCKARGEHAAGPLLGEEAAWSTCCTEGEALIMLRHFRQTCAPTFISDALSFSKARAPPLNAPGKRSVLACKRHTHGGPIAAQQRAPRCIAQRERTPVAAAIASARRTVSVHEAEFPCACTAKNVLIMGRTRVFARAPGRPVRVW